MKVNPQEYKSPIVPTWCPGCGNYIINSMLMQALSELNYHPHEVVLVYDIGCNGNGADKIRANVVKSLHGRPIPVALGIKYAREDLKVIAIGGDGGLFWEGVAHLIATAQRNEPIVVLAWDNEIYGLTTGQSAPTTKKGYKTPTYPEGTPYEPLNPIALVLSTNAGFVARTYTGDPLHLKETLKEAISYEKGFAFVDILQNCATYNPTVSYYRERVYKVKKPFKTKEEAIRASLSFEKIAIGVLWKE